MQLSLNLPLGTNSGFGRRMTQYALARGDKVIATGRSLEKLRAIPFVSASADNLSFVEMDVTEGSQSLKDKLGKAVNDSWGKCDVLVNNAGVVRDSPQSTLKSTLR